MASDDRTLSVLHALSVPRTAFDAALVSAIDELRTFHADQSAPAHERVVQESARLGSFAADRIDAGRFAAIVARAAQVTPAALERLARVLALLVEFRAQGDGLYRIRVEQGADLRDSVRAALAARGRLFNAARQVELLRSGVAVGDLDAPLDFGRWLKAERLLAPPLVVEVDGADLIAEGLAEYLDGALKLALVVRGSAPAAPLARLIAPHTFVMQTTDPSAVAALGAHAGAGIAAVLPDGCVQFVHDPARGGDLGRRLEVQTLPDAAPRAVGRSSAHRQGEELAWLRELAELAALARAQQQPDDAHDVTIPAADQLAGWLLRQAGSEPITSEAV